MLNDIVLDAALQSHHEVARSRAICHVCNTRYAPFPLQLSQYAHFHGLKDVAWVRKQNCVQYVCSYTLLFLLIVHVPGPSTCISQAVPPPSRPATPSVEIKVGNGSVATGTSTPTSVKTDGTIYLNCVNCNRPVRTTSESGSLLNTSQVSSNRYATHLSSCLGIGTGTRRGAARSTYTKPK